MTPPVRPVRCVAPMPRPQVTSGVRPPSALQVVVDVLLSLTTSGGLLFIPHRYSIPLILNSLLLVLFALLAAGYSVDSFPSQ